MQMNTTPSKRSAGFRFSQSLGEFTARYAIPLLVHVMGMSSEKAEIGMFVAKTITIA